MNLISPATVSPNESTVDKIVRDAANTAAAGITGIGTAIGAGVNLYNTMGNLFANPQVFADMTFQPQANPYMASMNPANVPQSPYAYAEANSMGNSYPTFLNNMNLVPNGGYPGFADPNYCSMLPDRFGYGGNL